MARTVAWLLGAVALVVTPAARAGDGSVPVRLELAGPFGCVPSRELLTALQSRNGRVRLAAGDEPALLLRVRVNEAAHTLRGELELIAEDGAQSTRAVEGDSCKAVVEALALTAALALQQRADVAEVPPAPPPRPAPSARRLPVAPTGDGGAAAKGRAGSRKRPHFEVGAQAAVAQLVTPHLHTGGSVLARVRSKSNMDPSLSLALLHTRNELFESSRHAALRFTGVSLTACPVRLEPLAGLLLEPCLSGTGAQLEAIGRELPGAQSVKRSWWGVGGLVRAAVWLGLGVSIEVEAGALVPLVERAFVAQSDGTSLGQTPALAPFTNAGVVYAL